MGWLYKKDVNERDYYSGVVSHPRSDIVECKVEWILGSTVVNKASGCNGIPGELFQTLKDDAIKVWHVTKPGRPSSGHRTEQGQSSSQSPRKIVLKNVLTIRQLHSSPMQVRLCLKSCMLGFRIMWPTNFQRSTRGLETAEEPEIKLQTFTGS